MEVFSKDPILILDFGSQYSQLIARRVREHNVYSQIVPYNISSNELKSLNPKGLILSGGPASVYHDRSPVCESEVFELGIPVLGICYGMQIGCQLLGSEVKPSNNREYGRTHLTINHPSPLLEDVASNQVVWMSHGDQVNNLSKEFVSLAQTENCPYAVVKHRDRNFYGVQFHPEVSHTPCGATIIRNFLFRVCGCKGDWQMSSYIEKTLKEVHDRVGKDRVVCALSGGVDSTVVASLIFKAIGEQLVCIFVDTGLLREGEAEAVKKTFTESFPLELHVVDARERFLSKLRGVTNPEQKRKIIGHEFIAVFKEEVLRLKGTGIKYLAQGTLYPDVIESVPAHGGPTASIKSHHNVGGLPKELGFELIEPLRELFKDEVRKIGKELGLSEEVIWRHPFPGPGLAIRIIGEVTEERLGILRQADKMVEEEIKRAGLYKDVAQAFAVLLPLGTVGVMGDGRTYENVIALRAVDTPDFMTADWTRFPYELLGKISSRMVNEIRGVNRVVYDITTKPPSTIEWE